MASSFFLPTPSQDLKAELLSNLGILLPFSIVSNTLPASSAIHKPCINGVNWCEMPPWWVGPQHITPLGKQHALPTGALQKHKVWQEHFQPQAHSIEHSISKMLLTWSSGRSISEWEQRGRVSKPVQKDKRENQRRGTGKGCKRQDTWG